MHILVADDDSVTSKQVCAMLRGMGHAPVPAFDAMQTLMAAMRTPPPDVIILDLSMPGGTGFGVLDKLQASSKTATIPVIVLSGTTDPDARQTALDSGAADFLAKPANADQLREALGGIEPPPV